MYLTGARPIELAYRVKRKDIEIYPQDTHITITMYTAKLQNVKGFNIPIRHLPIPREAPFVENVIIPYCQAFDDDPERILIRCKPDRIRQIVYAGSNNTLFPYNFRHNRLYKMGQDPTVSEQDLRNWKGGGNVRAYVAGKPIRRNIKIE